RFERDRPLQLGNRLLGGTLLGEDEAQCPPRGGALRIERHCAIDLAARLHQSLAVGARQTRRSPPWRRRRLRALEQIEGVFEKRVDALRPIASLAREIAVEIEGGRAESQSARDERDDREDAGGVERVRSGLRSSPVVDGGHGRLRLSRPRAALYTTLL